MSKGKPETASSVVTEAAAAYRESLENLVAAKERARAYRGRIVEVGAKVKVLRQEHSAALAAAVAALDSFIAGEISEDAAAAADAAVEVAARRVTEMEALAQKLGERPDPDLSKLYRARDDCREWLSLSLIQELLGPGLDQLKAALPEAFASWLFARPSAIQYAGSHSENQRLWKVFTADLLPECPDKATIEAGAAALARRVPEVA